MHEQQDQNEDAPKLRLKRNAETGDAPSRKCPTCGAEMAGDAVLCVQCGYDFRSGAVLKTSTGISHTLVVVAGVLISVVVAALAIVILVNIFKSDPAPVPPLPTEETPAQPLPAHLEESEAPVPAEPDTIEPRPELEPDKPVDPKTETDEDEPPEEPAKSEVDLEAEKAAVRRSLRESLDDRVPPHLIGDNVALRRLNGFVHRGKLVAIRDGMALVVDGEIRERVPLNELDRDSRLLVDEEFRERLVESRLRAMMENREE